MGCRLEVLDDEVVHGIDDGLTAGYRAVIEGLGKAA
jgi:hypothetical protein